MHVIIGVLSQLFDVRLKRIVDGEPHLDAGHDRDHPAASVSAIVNSSRYASRPVITCPDGSVTVTVCGMRAPALPRPAVLRIQHPLQERQALVSRGDAGEIAGRRMTTRARRVEVAPARSRVAGLQVGRVDAAAAASWRGQPASSDRG